MLSIQSRTKPSIQFGCHATLVLMKNCVSVMTKSCICVSSAYLAVVSKHKLYVTLSRVQAARCRSLVESTLWGICRHSVKLRV